MAKLKIEVTDEEFLQKSSDEQNLIMFKKLCNIDQKGCSWAQKREKNNTKKQMIVAGSTGLIGGFLAVVGKVAIWNK